MRALKKAELALLAVFCCAAPWALATPTPSSPERAAALAYQGRTQEAEAMLGDARPAGAAIFVKACLELDAGNPSGAAASLRVLSVQGAASGEVRLAQLLAERRARDPQERWLDSFFEAWRAVGTSSALAGTPVRNWTQMVSEGQRPLVPGLPNDLFWRAMLKSEPPLTELLSVQGQAETPARKLLLLAQLSAIPQHDAPAARALHRSLLAELQRTNPDESAYALMALLDQSDAAAPLSEREVSGLEVAVQKPRFGPSLRALYAEFRADPMLSSDDRVTDWAFAAASRAFPEAPGTLYLRAKASELAGTTGMLPRVAAILEKVGHQLAGQESMRANLLGSQLLVGSAELRGDNAAIERSRAARQDWRALYDAGKERLDYLEGWPLPSLRRELMVRSAEDEVALFHELALLPSVQETLPAAR
ncbi:MAG TPA: hypothetical protein VEG67_05905 [Myxococcota bacterium]|nr:hypothetical protein [Myxococcota bacterium]